MGWQDALGEQLLDPFRWGLIVALVVTMLRTESVTGRWLPLAAGVAFVAAIIPITQGGAGGPAPWRAVLLGLGANLAILAVVMAAREAWLRLRRR